MKSLFTTYMAPMRSHLGTGAVLALMVLTCSQLGACAVASATAGAAIGVAGAAAGAAVSVAGAAVGVTGKVIEKTIDAASGSDKPAQ